MVYVALLRGINVGGKNKVDMKRLKATFERVGMKSVVTYINSGNIIFIDEEHRKAEIAELLEKAIAEDFSLNLKVLIRSLPEYDAMMAVLPDSWKNDDRMKGDVLFLGEEIDPEEIKSKLTIKPGIDMVLFAPGAILWAVDKDKVTKSGLFKIVGTDLYKAMTVRNVNTTRKIYGIMKEMNEAF